MLKVYSRELSASLIFFGFEALSLLHPARVSAPAILRLSLLHPARVSAAAILRLSLLHPARVSAAAFLYHFT